MSLPQPLANAHSLLNVSFTEIVYAGDMAFCQAVTDNHRTAAVLGNHPGLSELWMLSPSPVKAEPNCSALEEDGLHITAWWSQLVELFVWD